MISRFLIVAFSVAVPSFAFAEEEAKPAGEKITYEQHVLPILREKCGTCHNANDKKGDLVLDNYSAAMRGGASGEVINIDGDADGSTLYRVIAHLDEPFMPPSQPKLPDEQIAMIKKWIEGVRWRTPAARPGRRRTRWWPRSKSRRSALPVRRRCRKTCPWNR